MVGSNLGKCEWVWEAKQRGPNPRWWNSRWLPSKCLVRMNEFESDWISLSQCQSGVRVFLSESGRRKQGVWIQHGRIQDNCHHQVESEWMSLSQIELVWVKSQSGGTVFWSESERRKQGVWIQDGSVWIQYGRIQDGCHHQVESEKMSEGFFLCKWWEPILARGSEFERKN